MAFKVLCALALLSAASAAAPGSRLTGGSPLPVEEFPSVVAITYYYPRPQITVQRCVGSLVSSIHVMTAASCFEGADLENMRVRAGSAQPLSGGTDVGVTHFIAHPDFEESPRTADIAVLFLEQFLPITSTVNILYLPPPGYDIPDGISLRVASWGFESLDGGPLNDLKSALLPKIPLAQCQQAFADSEEASITPSVVCTFAPGQGICHGDVGAPAVISNVLVGIASYYENCDGTHPDVWTRVDSYTTWIMQVTSGASRMLTV